MGAAHLDALHVPGSSPLHRLAPQCKIAATVAFVVAVVATPREAFWAFGVHAVVVAGAATIARLPARTVLVRLGVELPFVGFALALPFLAGGDRIDVVGVAVSSEGLWAAWNILAKATLGVAASVVLTATTPVPAIIAGLDRLRVPRPITAIMSFMVRYLSVITGEAQRMRIARLSRGHDPRWFWQARAVAQSAGTLFVRTFERGERVHLAMRARGYDGSMPALGQSAATRPEIAAATVVPAFAVLVAAVAWWA